MLDDLHIGYAVGGSIASSLFGEPRTTLDIDVALRGSDEDLRRLVDHSAADFYVPIETAHLAIETKDSFNLLHNESGIKVDLFVLGDSTLDRRQIDRRVRVSLSDGDLWVTSPEDIVLRKLWWYQLTDETSERQWRDVVSLFRSTTVDTEDILSAADEAGLTSLAQRAITEAAS